MKIAKEKVWANSKGKLVADGDSDAQLLVAAKGQEMADSELEVYKNADDFFEDAKKRDASEGNENHHKKKIAAHHK